MTPLPQCIRFPTIVLIAFAVMSSRQGTNFETRGDFILQVHNASISPNQTTSVSVSIHSNSADSAALFNAELLITPIGSTLGVLRFVPIQIADETADSDYIFASDSGGYAATPQNSPAFDSIVAGDFSGSIQDVTIGAAPRLLLRLEVEYLLPLNVDPASVVGEQFQISLVDAGNTFFLDSSYVTGPSIDPSSFSLGAAGLVTVQANTQSVPEPTSLVLLISAIAAIPAAVSKRFFQSLPTRNKRSASKNSGAFDDGVNIDC